MYTHAKAISSHLKLHLAIMLSAVLALMGALSIIISQNASASPTSLKVNFGSTVSGWQTANGGNYNGS